MDLFRTSFVLFNMILLFVPTYQVSPVDRMYEISVFKYVNQSGHHIVNFRLGEESRKGPSGIWQASFKHEISDGGEVKRHYVVGQLTAPPQKPKDYELFPGVGFYKFHPEIKTFADGLLICAREGGHLMVVNSQAEADIAAKLYTRHSKAWDWANIGFQDKNEDGDYETIYGQSLQSAGYNVWHPNEPDHSYGKAYCGVIHRLGRLGAGVCNKERPFICEFDLSWGV